MVKDEVSSHGMRERFLYSLAIMEEITANGGMKISGELAQPKEEG